MERKPAWVKGIRAHWWWYRYLACGPYYRLKLEWKYRKSNR